MTTNFYDLANERDDTLVKGLCAAARNMQLELREWVQSELKAALFRGETYQRLATGEIQTRINQAVERLRTMNHIDLPDAITTLDDKIADISQGGHTDVNDAYNQLLAACDPFVRLIRELLEIRRFIGEIGDE